MVGVLTILGSAKRGMAMRARRQIRSESIGVKRQVRTHRIARNHRGEDGFSLIELVIVMVILPIVVGGIAVALIGILENESTTFNRVSDSADASITAANFARDVQNASSISTGLGGQCTNGGSPPSGGSLLLGLQWGETTFRT